jgi:hypothetical protein
LETLIDRSKKKGKRKEKKDTRTSPKLAPSSIYQL